MHNPLLWVAIGCVVGFIGGLAIGFIIRDAIGDRNATQ